MKVEELRINNLVYVPETKQETNITAIYNHIGVIVNSSLVWLNISDVESIPLTEEWAKLKFDFINTKGWKGNGFDYQPETSKTNQSKYNIGNEIELVFERCSYRKTENDDWIHEDNIHIDFYGACIILYKYEVNVLQNLIHSLTGEELTIKTEK